MKPTLKRSDTAVSKASKWAGTRQKRTGRKESFWLDVEQAWLAGYRAGKKVINAELSDNAYYAGRKDGLKAAASKHSDSRQDKSKLVKDESLGVKPPACPKKRRRYATKKFVKDLFNEEEKVTKCLRKNKLAESFS